MRNILIRFEEWLCGQTIGGRFPLLALRVQYGVVRPLLGLDR